MLPVKTKNCAFSRYRKHICIAEDVLPWYDFDSTASTMEVAHKLVRENCQAWTVVTAHHQSSGRGTHGRSWLSQAEKGLWLSVIMPPPSDAGNLAGLSVLAAEALVKTLEMYADCRFSIKHPNDVIVNGRKIAGILLESATDGQQVQFVILGAGVNFWQTPEDFSSDGLPEATSLFIETGHAPDRDRFLISFIENLKSRRENI